MESHERWARRAIELYKEELWRVNRNLRAMKRGRAGADQGHRLFERAISKASDEYRHEMELLPEAYAWSYVYECYLEHYLLCRVPVVQVVQLMRKLDEYYEQGVRRHPSEIRKQDALVRRLWKIVTKGKSRQRLEYQVGGYFERQLVAKRYCQEASARYRKRHPPAPPTSPIPPPEPEAFASPLLGLPEQLWLF